MKAVLKQVHDQSGLLLAMNDSNGHLESQLAERLLLRPHFPLPEKCNL